MATVYEIWNRIKSKGLNDYAVAGIMGNLGKESGYISNNLENTYNTKFGLTDEQYTQKVDNGTYTNFANDSAGYGLAQWTYHTRKAALLEYAKKKKVSISDAMMQIDFMWEEMQSSYYNKMMQILKSAKSVKEASDAFLQYYEVPDNWQSKCAERAAEGQRMYNLYASKGNVTGGTTVSTFKARTTAPSTSDKYWIHTSKGGLNECILISGNSCIPNCVGYAWGRAYEILNSRPKLSRANAEDWWGYADGYSRSQTPSLGAIICWAKGKVGYGADGAGHVAVVEEIKPNGDVVTSNSGYNTTRFWMQTFTKASNYNMSGYTFQGFIHLIGDTTTGGSTGASSSTAPSGGSSSGSSTSVTEKRATAAAQKFDANLKGTYKVTATDGLHIRTVPGVINASTSMTVLPYQTKVQNYGYYTLVNGVKWLYIQVTYNGVKYTGFSSSEYLSK